MRGQRDVFLCKSCLVTNLVGFVASLLRVERPNLCCCKPCASACNRRINSDCAASYGSRCQATEATQEFASPWGGYRCRLTSLHVFRCARFHQIPFLFLKWAQWSTPTLASIRPFASARGRPGIALGRWLRSSRQRCFAFAKSAISECGTEWSHCA